MAFTVAAGNILEVTFPQRIFGQRVINVLHYKAKTASPTDGGETAVSGLVQTLNGSGGIISLMQALQAENVTWDNVITQIIHSTRRVKVEHEATAGAGTRTGNSLFANIQATIVKRTDLAGKGNYGAMRIAGMLPASASGGEWLPQFMVDLQVVADELSDPITANSVQWDPIVYRRAAPTLSQVITSAAVQDEVRTQRTRTLGRGE